jgi:hypothetical protein
LLGGAILRQLPSLSRFCAALLAVFCLSLSAAPEAHAGKGKGKPNVVRSSGQHMQGGHGSSFGQKRFHKRSKRTGFVRRRDRTRRHFNAPNYTYGYDSGYRYRATPRSEPSYRSAASAVVPLYQDRPVTPKWVHVSSTDGALGLSTTEGSYAEGGFRRNCLSVKTEITVDGKPMNAFGEACLSADGTWELKPSEQNE